jgi:hypothetical protein
MPLLPHLAPADPSKKTGAAHDSALAVVAAHKAISDLVEKLSAEAEQHTFRLDALLLENAELRSELARLQAEIETRAATPDPVVKAPRKPRAPKAPPTPVVPDQP